MPKDPAPLEFPKHPVGETWGKIYDCGCSAYGGKDLPDDCPEHGKSPKREAPATPNTPTMPAVDGPTDPPPQVPPGG